ncbi:MAG: hypothetical protein U0L73_13820, partial [Ruminococcus bromii]|nr:hypothetical protein [Ruminococcus bromii]
LSLIFHSFSFFGLPQLLTLSRKKPTHTEFQYASVFCFVSEHHLDGKAAAKEVGVRPIPAWWR